MIINENIEIVGPASVILKNGARIDFTQGGSTIGQSACNSWIPLQTSPLGKLTPEAHFEIQTYALPSAGIPVTVASPANLIAKMPARLTLLLIQGATPSTVVWNACYGAGIPPVTPAAGARDLYEFVSFDGATLILLASRNNV